MPIDGIININKPEGMTSHDVVGAMRHVFGMKRVGHTGTLDPMASGVLPVCLGKATRIMEYLDYDMKTYLCECTLGLSTDTLDIWGTKLYESGDEEIDKIEETDILHAISTLTGLHDQVPPIYSAIKKNGRRLYEYARAGEDIEIYSRKVYIERIDPVSFFLRRGRESKAVIRVVCARGTYIRSLCRDIGKRIGVPAVMSGLVRVSSGNFSLADAFMPDDLKAMGEDERNKLVRPIFEPLINLGRLVLSGSDRKRFVNGVAIAKEKTYITERPEYENRDFPINAGKKLKRAFKVFDSDGIFLGVGIESSGEIRPDKVLCAAL